MPQLAQALTVPSDLDAIWTEAQGYYDTLDATFKQYAGVINPPRPGALWDEDMARTAFKLVKLFYGEFLTHRKANSTMVWGCDAMLCLPGCTNLPTICGPNQRKKIVENFLYWITSGHLPSHRSGKRTKSEIRAVVGTDTQILGEILDKEPSDDIRQVVANLVGYTPMEWYLIPMANDPDKYVSWTVNGLLGIVSGWPGGGSLGEVPSYKTVSNALMSLRNMATKEMPENIRSQIVKTIRSRMTDNAGQGGALDIRNVGDRPGPWSRDERGKLYEQSVFLDSAITQLPIPVKPDPIPNPWRPGPGQVPDPGVYPPPKVGIFGKQTNLIFGIAAGVAVFAGAGILLWRYKQGHGRRPTPPLQPFGRAHFPNAKKIHTYVRRR